MNRRKNIKEIISMKGKERISALTAYDFQTASILDEAGIDIVLVGDSLGNVIFGYETTLPVTMEDILHHTKAVSRGLKNSFLVSDMPFKSFQVSQEKTIENACSLLSTGAQAVKIEGGEEITDRVKRLVELGIPVMGHIGLTPQSINQLGTYSIQGKEEKHADKLLKDAISLEKAGVFSIVLECVEAELAARITRELKIPTVGIGSGKNCDGQILVVNDLLGLTASPPKFVKKVIDMRSIMRESVQKFISETKER